MNIKHLVTLVTLAIASLLLFWLPFKLQSANWMGIDFSNTGMSRIVQNFDGINFLIVEKTWYDPESIVQKYQDVLVGRKELYFSAHYPGFPALIWLFDLLLTGPNALLLAVAVGNILLACGSYYFAYTFLKDSTKALWVGMIILFFPARMLADRVVGSNEPLFIFLVLMSLANNYKKRHWSASICGALAVLTRSPGILLFFAYLLQSITAKGEFRQRLGELLPYFSIPSALLILWMFYGVKFGSFWAYFQVGGNLNIYYPFAVFASGMDWVSGIWNEDLIYLFALIMIGGASFYRRFKNTSAMWFVGLYGMFVMYVAHRDLARYSLPLMPILAILIPEFINNKYLKVAGAVLLLPTFMYAWQFVIANYQPIVNWVNYL